MEPAITELQDSLERAEGNAVAAEAEGDRERAEYLRRCAESYRAAIERLKGGQ